MISIGSAACGLAYRMHTPGLPPNPVSPSMLRASLFALATLTVASSASAEFVDFTNASQFGGSNYATSTSFNTQSGATATIVPGPSGATMSWTSGGGLGVRYNSGGAYEWDEIEGPETLSISFSEPVYIESVSLANLYRESGLLTGTYSESGSFRLSNGTTGSIVADSTPSGNQTIGVGAWTSSIVFRAAGYVGGIFGLGTQNHEYSLAGITFGGPAAGPTSVPELDPSAAGAGLMLLLGGLMVLGGKRRNALLS